MDKSDRSLIVNIIRNNDKNNPPKSPVFSKELTDKIDLFFRVHSKLKMHKLDQLHMVYSLLDEIMREVSTISVCNKGCAYCCKLKLDVLPIEVEYIERYTIVKKNKKPLKWKLDYCPFLDRNTATCTVYEYRPFNCRAFMSFDSPDYCRDEQAHFTTGGPENGYGNRRVLSLAYKMIELDTGKEIALDLLPVLEKRIRDLRSYFKG